MPATHDNEASEPPDDEAFGPQQAAALLDQSTRDATRQFDAGPPALLVGMAVLVLGAYVAMWLSSRGQHPYSGPSGWAIVLTYAVVVGAGVAATKVYRTATVGITGSTIRQQRIEGIALLASILSSPMIQGARYHYHASDTIVYGVIPAAGPLIIIGTTMLGIAGSKADWPSLAAASIVVITGMVALWVGPSGAWLVAGLGVSIAIVCYAATRSKLLGSKGSAWTAPTPSTR
jgi:hypothetical protein